MCTGYETQIISTLPEEQFSNENVGSCDSSAKYIKAGNSNYWNCATGAVIIDLGRLRVVTMVTAEGDDQFKTKFQLFYSIDGTEYTKIVFSTNQVRIFLCIWSIYKGLSFTITI